MALLLVGAASGCDQGSGGGPMGPTGPIPPGSTIEYAALGASDVNGVGASVPCTLFLDCPDGTGYVFVAARQLRAQGYTVNVSNRGIPTAVISPRLQQLGLDHGRTIAGNIIDNEVPFVPRASTLATIFGGANDVNVIVAALGDGAGGNDPAGYVDQQVRTFADEFATLIDGVRERADDARLVVLNVPNLGALPSMGGASLPQRQAAQRAAVGITRTVLNPLTAQGIRVIDLMCEGRLYQPANLSSDGFHPNDAGYAILAAEVVRAATAESYPAPRDSCAQMTAVP